MNRWKDWWDQGERDVRHAGHALEDADYEWSAFASQQGAEKALKALILPRDIEAPPGLIEAANRLDKHYIPARYPNGFASGYPGKLYTLGEAEGAIADAQEILEFCRRRLP
jgi:HEPN domain-containing protein